MTTMQLYTTYTLPELLNMRQSLWNDVDAKGRMRDPEMFYKVGIAINWHNSTRG
jgi:hypothetical protein